MENGKIGGIEIPMERMIKKLLEKVSPNGILETDIYFNKIKNNPILLEKAKANKQKFLEYMENHKSQIRTPNDLTALLIEAYNKIGKELMTEINNREELF